jgi:hypothetical protein
MTANVDRGTELLEILRLERLDRMRLDVKLLRSLDERQSGALARVPQARADALASADAVRLGSHGRPQPGLGFD